MPASQDDVVHRPLAVAQRFHDAGGGSGRQAPGKCLVALPCIYITMHLTSRQLPPTAKEFQQFSDVRVCTGTLRPEVQVVNLKTVDFTYGPKRLRTSGPGPSGAHPVPSRSSRRAGFAELGR